MAVPLLGASTVDTCASLYPFIDFRAVPWIHGAVTLGWQEESELVTANSTDSYTATNSSTKSIRQKKKKSSWLRRQIWGGVESFGLTEHPDGPHAHQSPDVGFRGREEEVVGEEGSQPKADVGLDLEHLVQRAAWYGGIALLL